MLTLICSQGGEARETLTNVIINANNVLRSTRYGADAVSFQLAQVGNDMKARAFLEEIDNHPIVGDLVDVRQNFLKPSWISPKLLLTRSATFTDASYASPAVHQ